MSEATLHPALRQFASANQLEHLHRLPFGKALFASSDGRFVAKLASSARGRALIRAEAEGLKGVAPLIKEAVAVPRIERFIDDEHGVALVMSKLAGAPASKWRAPDFALTPALRPAATMLRLGDFLDVLGAPEALAAALLRRFGDSELLLTPSHGDLIYWNVLRGPDGPGLVDFEYADAARLVGFDDLHYRYAPNLLRALRWNLPSALPMALGLHLSRNLCAEHRLELDPKLMLALFFVQWASIRRRFAFSGTAESVATVENLALRC